MSLRVKRSNLQQILGKHLKAKIALKITDNASVFLRADYRRRVWHIRLHWMFQKAEPSLQKHIARYIDDHNKESSSLIDRFIEDHWHWVHHRMPPIVTKGKIYDLEKLFKKLNRDFLEDKVTAKITWGPSASRRAYEQLQMGSYSTSKNLITVHPHLDQKFVPQYVVEGTIFHEMCHALVPVRKVNGRREIHPPTFKTMETIYPHLKKALEWEGKNLSLLMRKPRKK